MAYVQDEQSSLVSSSGFLFNSTELLVEKLRASEARIQALEVEVRSLKAENNTLRSQVSPQRPVPRLESTQLPPEPFTIAFHIEKPQDLPTKRNVNEEQSRELRELLNRLPKTDQEWCQRRRDVQLSNPEEVTRTFLSFITRTKSQATTPEIQVDPQSLTVEQILRNYRQFVDFLRQDGVRAHQISNFAILLLVCLCRVAREDGVLVETVDEVLDDILPRTRNREKRKSVHLRHLRTAVLWPVRQAELLREKYAHRADEFFLLYGPSIKTYERLGQDNDAKRFAWLAKLPLPPVEETNADVPFSVPLMVKLIAGRSFSINLINKALKTNMCQEGFDAAVSSIWARTQHIRNIQFPPPKRRKISDSEECVQHGRDLFSQRGSSSSVADSTGRLPYGPDARSPENGPATNFDRCKSELADRVRPGNLTVDTQGQELFALQLSTSFCPPERIPADVAELFGIHSQTEVLTLPWHASPAELANDVPRPPSGPSLFTEVMRLMDEPRVSEINLNSQYDGREGEAGEESFFGELIEDADHLFEQAPSNLSF